MLWIILSVIGAMIVLLVVAGVVLAVIGKGIPAEHMATSAIDLNGYGADVFKVIEDIAAYPKWAPGVTSIERLEARNGLETARMRMGRNSFVLMRTAHEPPHRLERTITDDHKAFSGIWAYTVEDREPGRCRVKLKETGRVGNPLARAMMKYVFGYHLYINKHLAGLAKGLGQEATPHRA